MKLGILKTDAVRPEWVPDFGEYPDMFITLLGRLDPAIEFSVGPYSILKKEIGPVRTSRHLGLEEFS